jgi:hypothetical protein
MFMPSSYCKPFLVFGSSSGPIQVYFLDDNNEDENMPTPPHLPRDDSIEHEPVPTPLLPRSIHST